MQIAVLGAGAWGTALALSFARVGHRIQLWTQDAAHASSLQAERENARYLPGFALPDGIEPGADFAKAVEGADLALIVTPIAGLRNSLEGLSALHPDCPALWACKGFERGSGKLPHEIAAGFPGIAGGALTGPSFAQEVAQGLPCAIALASPDAAFAARWAQALRHPQLRVYGNDDVIGAEVGGAVKNVLAIAAGISDGLGFGYNARAALITRGLAEIARLAEALGGRRETLMGLAGMGDLILTCTGDLSRNRRVGLALAAGQSLDAAVTALGHVAEGVTTCAHVVARAAALGVDMPITQAVHAVLSGTAQARQAVEQLMARDTRSE